MPKTSQPPNNFQPFGETQQLPPLFSTYENEHLNTSMFPHQNGPILQRQRSSTNNKDVYPLLLRSFSSSSNSSGHSRQSPPKSRQSPKTAQNAAESFFLNTPYPGQESCRNEIMDIGEAPLMPFLGRSFSDEMDTSFPGSLEGTDPLHQGSSWMSRPPIKLERQQNSLYNGNCSTNDMDFELPPNMPLFQQQPSFRGTVPLKFDAETTKEFTANWNQTIFDLKTEIVRAVRDLSSIELSASNVIVKDWDKTFHDNVSLGDLLRKDTRLRTLQVLFKVPVIDEDEQEREVICEWKVSGLCTRIAQHLGVEPNRITPKFGNTCVMKDEHVFRFINNPNGHLLTFSVLPQVIPKLEPQAPEPPGPPTAPPLMPNILVDPSRPQITAVPRRRDTKVKQFPPPADIYEITDPQERRSVWCPDCQAEAKVSEQRGELVKVRCNWIRVWRPRKYERGKPRKYYSCNQDGCQISITKDLAAKRSHAHNHTKNFKCAHILLGWKP